MTANDKDNWRDARLKKALDSAPDAQARPGETVREAILQQARLKAQVAAPRSAARARRGWHWAAGTLATAGALMLVLMVRQEAPLSPQQQMPTPMAQAPSASTSPPVVVAQEPARPAAEAKAGSSELAKARDRKNETQLRADAGRRRPAEPPRVEIAAAEPARSAADARVLADAAPPAVVAAAPAAPPPTADSVSRPETPGSWTVLRLAMPGGPVLITREQLPPDTLARLTSLRAQAAATTPLARMAPSATGFAADKLASPAGLRLEFLQGDRPVGRLNLGSEAAELRQQLESAALKAAAPGKPGSAASAQPD